MKNKRNFVLKAEPLKRDANGNPIIEIGKSFKPSQKRSKKRNR